MSDLLTITEENFEAEVMQSDIPVILDFWAEWCGPCVRLGPVLEAVAKEYEGKIKVGKVNLDQNRALAQKFNIRSIPVVLSIKGGEEIDRMVGFDGTDKGLKRLFDNV